MRDEFVRMDRELAAQLRMTGTVEGRERLVIANLIRKEAIIKAEMEANRSTIVPFKLNR